MIGQIINDEFSNLGSTLIRKEDFLGSISIKYGMMEVPSLNLTLPITYSKYLSGNTRIRLKANDWTYEGFVDDKSLNTRELTVTINTSHVVGRLDKRTIPTNITIKGKNVKDTIEHVWGFWKTENNEDSFVQSFTVDYIDDYALENFIEYEFSNETLLQFLNKVCDKTQSMYWRVNRYDPYVIEFGIFGSQKDVLINEYNYLVSLDDIREDFKDVVNVSVVMSDKSDGGASSLTLRDIFHNKKYMVKGFPVFKTGKKVNTQRSYNYPQIPQFAPEIIGDEFYVMDEEGVALEAGELYWGTTTDNDTQAIAEENKELTNDDRIKATEQLYHTAIRRLKNSRRKVIYGITNSPLPDKTVQVGDRVMFSLNVNLWELTACSKYYEKVLKQNDWFFVTNIEDTYSEGNAHIQKLSLSKYIYSDRDLSVNS